MTLDRREARRSMKGTRMNRKFLVRWGAAAAAFSLLAACSSSSKGSGAPSATATSAPPSTSQSASAPASTSASASAPASTSASASAPPSSTSASTAADPFATPNKATGTPITVGVLGLEIGPVTFPNYRQAVDATIQYINDYKGGVGGHPLKLVHCETDGQPSTSQRCANQILDSKPTFIVGGADTGSSGAYPVWQRAGLAVVGGVPFTPVEQSYANGVVFAGISGPDNAAGVTYAQQQGAKSGTVVYTSDTQGTDVGKRVQSAMTKLGMGPISMVPVPPTAADVSTQAATVVSAGRDLVYITTPVGCASMLKSLHQLGYKGKVYVIDPCTDPRVIAAAGAGAENMTWGGPIDPPNSSPDSTLYMQILNKYTPNVAITTITEIGVQTIMNIQSVLSPIADNLTTATIIAAFKKGTNNPNFAAHPYTCDGQQLPNAPADCNGYQHIFNYSNGKITTIGDWVNPSPAMS